MSVHGHRSSSRSLVGRPRGARDGCSACSCSAARAQAAVPGSPTGLGPDGRRRQRHPRPQLGPPGRRRHLRRPGLHQSRRSRRPRSGPRTAPTTTRRRRSPSCRCGTIYWRVRAHNASRGQRLDDRVLLPPVGLAADPQRTGRRQGPAGGRRHTGASSGRRSAGATGYIVRIGQDPDFTDPSPLRHAQAASQAQAAALNGVLQPNTYYWEVQAQLGSGYSTDWSTPRTLTILGLAPARAAGPTGRHQRRPPGRRPRLDARAGRRRLRPPGEHRLQLHHYRQPAIATTEQHQGHAVLAPDHAQQRPVLLAGPARRRRWLHQHTGAAAPIWHFKRNWPDQPDPAVPRPTGSTVSDPFYYQWTPVPHASRYVVQLSTDTAFTDGPTTRSRAPRRTRRSRRLTWNKTNSVNCMPSSGGTYYWRVYAIDGPRSPVVQTDYIAATKNSFTYAPTQATQLSPPSGSTVSVPILTWNPVATASQYQVTWTDVSTSAMDTATTAANVAHPADCVSGRSHLPLERPADDRWQLRARAAAAHSPHLTCQRGRAQKHPHQTRPTRQRPRSVFPTLTWMPVQGANRYHLFVRRLWHDHVERRGR